MIHVCTSDASGLCADLTCPHLTGVNAPPPVAGSPVRATVAALRAFRAYRADWLACNANAHAFGLAGVVKGLARIKFAHNPGKLATYQGEVARADKGADNRRKQAEAAKARKIATQAKVIALRASQEVGYTVAVLFKRGAVDVRLVKADAVPKGYQESRAARKVRGEAPALRYHEAERIALGVAKKMGARARLLA